MGLRDFIEENNPLDTSGGFASVAPFDPAADFRSGEFGETAQLISDPLDIFGVRAEDTAAEIARLNQQAADEALGFQKSQLGRVEDLFDPFAQAGKIPLEQLVAMITGEGDFDFTPSAGFEAGLERGTRATKRSAASRGLLNSSGTEARLADVVNAATGQEVQQQIENRLSPVRTAQDASSIIGQQAQATAGAGSSIFGNLANQNIQNAANFGQARQSAFDSASGTLAGLANLFATQ